MDTSSQRLNRLFNKLKVPEDCRLAHDADVDWMWADPQCALFLDWITENLSESNLVTPSQRRQFEILSQQGQVLSGRCLDDALHTVSSLDQLSEEELDVRIKSMSVKSEKLRSRKSRLQQMSSGVSQKIAETQRRIEQLDAPIGQMQRTLSTQLQECEDEHTKFQDLLADLRDIIQRLHLAYSGSDRTSAKLLSHTDLQPLSEAEQSYNVALAQFTEKRFFDGLSDMAGSQDESFYQLINLSNPQLLPLKQDTGDKISESCAELNRLRHAHCISLQQSVDAQVNSAMSEAACEALENSLSRTSELETLETLEQLRSHLERVKGKQAIYSRELNAARHGNLQSLVERTSSLKEAYILTGDYNLKIARQQYFLSCQRQVIDKLVDQRARNEMLSMMLDVEMEDVQQTRHVLASITAFLQQLVSASRQRLAVLEDAEVLSHKYDRKVIDSRDVLLNTVDRLVEKEHGTDNPEKVFPLYKELASNAHSFLELHKERVSSTDSFPVESQLISMKELSDACLSELMLTPGSDTIDSLSPSEISGRLSELKVQLKLLESNIKTIMSTITQKRKLLAER